MPAELRQPLRTPTSAPPDPRRVSASSVSASYCTPTSAPPDPRRVSAWSVSAVARKSVILDGTSTTTCRGCMSEHRRQEPIWTSVRGAGVKAVSPAERGRREATRLDVGEHTRTLLA